MALVAAVAFGPLGALLAAAAARTARDPSVLLWAVPGERLGLLVRSVAFSAAVALVTVAVGVLAATVLWRRRGGRLAAWRWAVLAMVAVPAYVHALAWSRAAFALRSVLEPLGLPAPPSTGLALAAWVQGMTLLPLATGLGLLALEAVPDELVDAGRVLQPDGRVLWLLVLPLAGPALAAAAALLFVLSLLDYSVPALFQVNAYALAVFAQYSATYDATRALLVALPMCGAAAVAVLVALHGARRAAQRLGRRNAPGVPRLHASPALRVAQGLALALVVAQAAVPLVILSRAVGSPRALGPMVAAARDEIAMTLAVAALAAGVAVPLAVVAANGLSRRGTTGAVWWMLVAAPLALPASLVGIGLIQLWIRPGLPGVYGSAAMPVLAAAARFVPYAALAVAAQARRVDPLLIDAARVHRTSWRAAWLRVRLPLLAPGLIAAACLTFVLTVGELGATVVVAAPGRQTLTLLIYNYLHYGASDAVAGLCLVLAVAALAVMAVGLLALSAWSRLGRRRVAPA